MGVEWDDMIQTSEQLSPPETPAPQLPALHDICYR
jgi:hypothetical protein